MNNMEKSVIEAVGFGGMTGYYNPNSRTHSITEQEHKAFLKLQEERKKEKEKKEDKTSK